MEPSRVPKAYNCAGCCAAPNKNNSIDGQPYDHASNDMLYSIKHINLRMNTRPCSSCFGSIPVGCDETVKGIIVPLGRVRRVITRAYVKRTVYASRVSKRQRTALLIKNVEKNRG
jgi:hypothetical protein